MKHFPKKADMERFFSPLFLKNFELNRQLFSKFFRKLRRHFRKNEFFYEKLALSGIYFCANSVLLYSVKMFSGYIPAFIQHLPFLNFIFESKFLKFLGRPEQSYVFYTFLFQFLIFKPVIRLSLLMRYNLLLLFTLEMIENLILGLWDTFLAREIMDGNAFIFGIYTKTISQGFLGIVYSFFFFTYLYCYICSLQNKYPKFPGEMKKITDSVLFWLKAK